MKISDFNVGNLESYIISDFSSYLFEEINKKFSLSSENVNYCGFDESFNMFFFESKQELDNSNISLKKILYNTLDERVSVEYTHTQIAIGHYFNPINNIIDTSNYLTILSDVFNELKNVFLVVGFELSYNLIDFEKMLLNNKIDESQFPFYTLKKNDKKILVERYVSQSTTRNKIDISCMDKYLQKIISSLVHSMTKTK